MKLYLVFILSLITSSIFGQAITGYELSNSATNTLKVASTFDNASSSVFQDNSTINVFIPNGYTNPVVSSLQGGSWSVSSTIPNANLVAVCGSSANDYYMLAISTNSVANLGSVATNVAEDLFTITFSGTSTLSVIGFDPAGGNALSTCVGAVGVDNTASIDPDGNGATGTTGYSNVPISPITVALPVELISFTAEERNRQIALNWKSASEVNFDGYEIQRSTNGTDFQKIGWIEGKGGVNEASYMHIDETIIYNKSYYYRLKMIDLDGEYEFSPVRTAMVKAEGGSVSVFPNPIGKNEGRIMIQNTNEERVRFVLFDATGKLMRDVFIAPETMMDLDLGKINPGFLMYKIETSRELKSGKLIVQ